MDQDLPITLQAEIVDEHELLDGAGTVWSIHVRLVHPVTPEGRLSGYLSVTETAGQGNRRQLVFAVHYTNGPFIEAGFSALPEQRPKRGPFLIKRPRRLAAIARLLQQGAALREYGGFSELTWNDRDQRSERDRLGRQWTIHEVTTTRWGGALVRASCRWPTTRLSVGRDISDISHHVFEVVGKIRDLRFGFSIEVPFPDEKGRRRFVGGLTNGQWTRLSEPSLAELLVGARAGFHSPEDARAVYAYLRGKEPLSRHRVVQRESLWREDVSPPPKITDLEVVEQREVCRESFGSITQGGHLYLVRVAVLAAGRERRQTAWLALHAGAHHDLPTLRDLVNEQATCLTLAETWHDLVPRLLVHHSKPRIVSLGVEEMDWTEASARRAWKTAIAEDDVRRRKQERQAQHLTLLARAFLEDGRQVLRLKAEWMSLDPVLTDEVRPIELVVVIGADGIDILNLDSGDGVRSYNPSSREPTNITEALALLPGHGPEAENARWHLDYLLRTCGGGFADSAAADEAWTRLVGEPVARYEMPATETWAKLWEKRGSLIQEAGDDAAPEKGDETRNDNESPEEMALEAEASPQTSDDQFEAALECEEGHVSTAGACEATVSPLGDETSETKKPRRGRPPGPVPAKTSTERSRLRRSRLRQDAETLPRKGGRPPKGEVAMTGNDRMRQYRKRLSERKSAAKPLTSDETE